MSGISTITGALPSYLATATVPALTTIFTPPSSCNNRWLAASGTSDIAWSTYSRDGYQPPVDPLYYSCLPRNLKGPYYSPGACTNGQTVAGLTKYEISSSKTMWQAACCDRGLTITIQTIDKSAIPMCVSAFSTQRVHALQTTTYANGVQSQYYDYVVNDKSTISSISTMTSGTAIADPLYVAFESSDLADFPTAYATSLAQKIGVAFTPTSRSKAASETASATSSTDATSSSSSSSGLSKTTKIGLGIGLGVGIVLIGVLIGLLFIIRRLKKARGEPVRQEDSLHELTGDGQQHHELSGVGQEQGAGKGKWGLTGGSANGGEVKAANAPVTELDSLPVQAPQMQPVEMDATPIQHR